MSDIFQLTQRPDSNLFFRNNDPNDSRLGEIVLKSEYSKSEIVILGCPQDEGVRRNKGRAGAALAPDAIRQQFYKLTNFGIKSAIFDLGNTLVQESLEATHDLQTRIVEQLLVDDKKIVILGGGNDISFADGSAMANVFGTNNWQALNVDAHFDVRNDFPRNSGTPYRQLLDGKLLSPLNFYEIAYQSQAASPIYFDYLQNLAVNLISLEEFKNSNFDIETKISSDKFIFWGFDVDSVRSADAPGVSAPSPIGLTAEEFCSLVSLAGGSPKTKIVEFTEVNPSFDIDNRTAKLVAIAMHQFISAVK